MYIYALPTYQTRPKAPIPTGWRSEYLELGMVVKRGFKVGHKPVEKSRSAST